MNYLEYEKDTRIVTKIHEFYPENIRDGHEIAKNDFFDKGMEIEFVITVDTVNQEGMTTATSTTKQTVPAYQLLTRIEELNNDNRVLKEKTKSQDMVIEDLMFNVIPFLGGI